MSFQRFKICNNWHYHMNKCQISNFMLSIKTIPHKDYLQWIFTLTTIFYQFISHLVDFSSCWCWNMKKGQWVHCQIKLFNSKSLSCVQLFMTSWTEAHQAPLSMEFSRLWVTIPFFRGTFLTQGSNPGLLNGRQILYRLSHEDSGPKDICISVS